jgi:hypothetical protein
MSIKIVHPAAAAAAAAAAASTSVDPAVYCRSCFQFLYSISLKILIAVTLAPTVAAACYMQW